MVHRIWPRCRNRQAELVRISLDRPLATDPIAAAERTLERKTRLLQMPTATDLISQNPDADEGSASERRLDSLLSPGLRRTLTVLGFGLPTVACLVLVVSYGLNIIVNDQWNDVTVIRGSYTNFPDWSLLWQPHNENRIFFPNLIVVALAHFDHFNITHEEFLGTVMLIAAYALLILAHRRRSPSIPWLYYCPVMILGLCLAQWQNMLWGFQMAWFLVMLTLAATVYLLDRIVLSRSALIGAVVVAIIGSYSSLQGLTIWAAGIVLLFYRRRSVLQILAWVATAVVVIFWYFFHFHSTLSYKPGYAHQHPIFTLKFVLFEIGDIAGVQIQHLGTSTTLNYPVFLFGIALVCVAILSVVVACGLHRDTGSGRPIGVALILVGLLFALMVAQGRVFFGYSEASQSRYTTFNLLLLVGIYFILLPTRVEPVPARTKKQYLRPLRTAAAALIVIEIVVGTYNGIYAARANHQYQVELAVILRNYKSEPNGAIGNLYFFESPSYIRHQARIAHSLHLSLFASP